VIVLDASAILALIHDEPGADLVASKLDGSALSAANLAEVVGKLVDLEIDPTALRPLLFSAGVAIEPLTADDAVLAGALRETPAGRALSLGDRCCLALALKETQSEVLTADRAWEALDLPLKVRLLR
jgi:ribonuclease VapC